ncbi:hypothetical protein [Rothia nasimurium]|uniref:hypothetical protein n=1 Tax=Rothia nasimurium TaxID=85336 RepID=UPI002DD67B0A|nr:hypothetical protein [Rothia nasimurium]
MTTSPPSEGQATDSFETSLLIHQCTAHEPAVTTAPLAIVKPSFITGKLLVSFFVAVLLIGATSITGMTSAELSLEGALTLVIFILAIWAWVCRWGCYSWLGQPKAAVEALP